MTAIQHLPALALLVRHGTRERLLARDPHCDRATCGRSVPSCSSSGACAIWRSSAPATLALAWTKVRANKGAAGVDGAWAGDSSGICAKHLGEARGRAITAHWIECGRRPYCRCGETEKGWAGTSAPKCPICEVPLIACGGGEEFDSWACDGCGKKATSHVDGRVAWAERGFNGYPRWNEDGTVQQAKS
jgi:hypothetical protein